MCTFALADWLLGRFHLFELVIRHNGIGERIHERARSGRRRTRFIRVGSSRRRIEIGGTGRRRRRSVKVVSYRVAQHLSARRVAEVDGETGVGDELVSGATGPSCARCIGRRVRWTRLSVVQVSIAVQEGDGENGTLESVNDSSGHHGRRPHVVTVGQGRRVVRSG